MDVPCLMNEVCTELNRLGRSLVERQRALLAAYMGPGRPGHSSLDGIYPVFTRDYPFGFLALQQFLYEYRREITSGAYKGLWTSALNCGDGGHLQMPELIGHVENRARGKS
jgi:hypothetical protein